MSFLRMGVSWRRHPLSCSIRLPKQVVQDSQRSIQFRLPAGEEFVGNNGKDPTSSYFYLHISNQLRQKESVFNTFGSQKSSSVLPDLLAYFFRGLSVGTEYRDQLVNLRIMFSQARCVHKRAITVYSEKKNDTKAFRL